MKFLSILIWVAILTLTGTHFRVRDGRSIESLEIDWLIILQILVCLLGGLIGVVYMLRQKKWGFGTKALATFIFLAIISAIFNPYPSKVVGYWILLAGSGVLTMRLVYMANNAGELKQIENVWWGIITVLIFKDAITSILLMSAQEAASGIERLGMGVTHANFISFLAVIAFWLSFKSDEVRIPRLLLWILRLFYLGIIILARSRMSMICLLLGGIIRIWFIFGQNRSYEGWYLRFASLSLLTTIVLGFMTALLVEIPIFNEFFEFVSRGQEITDIISATGRTSIWSNAIDKIFEDAVSFIFGHGYGMSRFVLNEGYLATYWYAYHAHNAYLEVLLSMGFIGFCSFMILAFYNFSWAINFKRLTEIYSFQFALRAVIVVSMILFYSITEASLAIKISPIMIIFLFYLLALDRRNEF